MRNFIKVNLTKTNTAYFDAETVKRVVETETEQNGSKTRRTIITFDDGATITCVDSAENVIALIEGRTGKEPRTDREPIKAAPSKTGTNQSKAEQTRLA